MYQEMVRKSSAETKKIRTENNNFIASSRRHRVRKSSALDRGQKKNKNEKKAANLSRHLAATVFPLDFTKAPDLLVLAVLDFLNKHLNSTQSAEVRLSKIAKSGSVLDVVLLT